MNIEFSKMEVKDSGEAFEIFRKYMKPTVDAAIGWDEQFQRSGFDSKWNPDHFSWIVSDAEKAGFVCCRLRENSVHIHLLIVFEGAQRTGIATSVMERLREDAFAKCRGLTLSCFKNNAPALSLYKRYGFVVCSDEGCFYELAFPFEKA